jgi:1-phosphofructokinase
MIITVTTNPSIDRTLSIDDFKPGGVIRAQLVRLDAAGKGVNVSRALAAYGVETHALMIGASLGNEWFSEQLNAQGIPHTVVMAEGVTRSNLTLVEADGNVTKINEPGIVMTPEIHDKVLKALDALPLAGNTVVFAGRLNPGASDDTYREFCQHAKKLGAHVVLDASGTALANAITADGPDLIKPNQFELGGLVGRELNTIDDAIVAAREVMARGVGAVLCSLGKDGAIFVTNEKVVHVEAKTKIQGTPVGAGDILLATFLAGGANENALEAAVQWSAASVALPGTSIPTPAQAAAIEVLVHHDIDVKRSLSEAA